MKLIFLAVIALGSVSTLILWYLKRYHSRPDEIVKLRTQVDEITKTIVSLEKQPRTYARLNRLRGLYDKRTKLNRRIRRLKG